MLGDLGKFLVKLEFYNDDGILVRRVRILFVEYWVSIGCRFNVFF